MSWWRWREQAAFAWRTRTGFASNQQGDTLCCTAIFCAQSIYRLHKMFLFCGGVSSAVCDASRQLADTCNLRHPGSLRIVDSTQTTSVPTTLSGEGHQRGPTELIIEKCGHRLPSEDVCGFCSNNRSLLSERLRRVLEHQDTITSSLVVADCCSSSSMWTYDQSMEIMSEMLPKSALGTMLILPLRPITGWDSYFATYCFSLSLATSTYTIIRNMAEPFANHTSSTESTKSSKTASDLNLFDCAERIAADFLPNFILEERSGSRNEHQNLLLWPYTVTSHGDRIVDMKSSLLYKLQALKRKKPSRDHMHPLRVVASSLHRLSTFYQDVCATSSSLQTFNQQDQYLIDYRELVWDKSYGAISCNSMKKNSSANDLSKICRHATPGLTWCPVEEFVPSVPLESDEKSTASKRASASSNSSKVGIAYENSLNEREKSESMEDIGCLVFQSPFGEMELQRTTHYARNILEKGAYRHLFNANFDEDTVLDCINIVETYLEH